jgi:hypothetical protein
MSSEASILLVACGALARETQALKRLGGWEHVAVRCLPAEQCALPSRPAHEASKGRGRSRGRRRAAERKAWVAHLP